MIIKHITFYLTLLLFSFKAIAQTNSLSSSPYSLYGLGQTNETNTGTVNGLGKSGIAIPSSSFINNSNPASFAAIPINSFFYDFGIKGETNLLSESGRKNSNITANFSNIAIAFPLSKKSRFGATLMPFTSVGYTLDYVESNIEGSNDSFYTDVYGSGGINNLKLNYGYALNDKLRLGLMGSVLFGKISQTQINYIPIVNNSDLTTITLNDDSYYSGFRLGSGFQYNISKNISVGGIINLPTKLNGNKETIITSSAEVLESSTSNSNIDNFNLPLELGVGFQTKLKDVFSLNIDYKKSFWDDTNQKDLLGTYVDQDFVAIGIQYSSKNKTKNLFTNLEYRVGFNYDTGNLEVNTQRIKNNALNLGVGIPFNRYTNSMINIGYSYGSKGQISNGLIQENYHLLSINVSLEGIWFQKGKYD